MWLENLYRQPESADQPDYQRVIEMVVRILAAGGTPTAVRATVTGHGKQGLKLVFANEHIIVLQDTSSAYQEFWFITLARDGKRLVGYNLYGASPSYATVPVRALSARNTPLFHRDGWYGQTH